MAVTRDELLTELAKENAIGIQLLSPFVPEIDVVDHLYSEVIRRNPDDPSATDADILLHVLSPTALIICGCSVTAIETVDVGGRVEIKRGAKECTATVLPLSRIKKIELASSTGSYQGRTAEPDEPHTLTIEFEEAVTPSSLVLPREESLEGRPQEEIRATHESVLQFGQRLIAGLAR